MHVYPCVQISHFYNDRRHIGLGSILMTSFLIDYLGDILFLNKVAFLITRGPDFNISFLGGGGRHNLIHNIYLYFVCFNWEFQSYLVIIPGQFVAWQKSTDMRDEGAFWKWAENLEKQTSHNELNSLSGFSINHSGNCIPCKAIGFMCISSNMEYSFLWKPRNFNDDSIWGSERCGVWPNYILV